MHQIKLFKGVESEVSTLESDVNAWLTESGAKVVNIFGNIAPQTLKAEAGTGGGGRAFAPSDLFIAVLYEQ